MITSTGAVRDAKPTEVFDRYRTIHAATEGWFSIEAAALWDSLLAFQAERKIAGHLLEIGVWHGKSAALMALRADAARETCFLVDSYVRTAALEATLLKVRPKLDESIRVVQCESARIALSRLMTEAFQDLRWIHIDGEHTAGAVYGDLVTASSLLAKEGIVAVDDFFSPLYPQITEAVFRHLRDHPQHFRLFLAGFNKAYLARPHFVHEYLEFLGTCVVDALESRGVRATLTKTTFAAELNCFGLIPRYQGRRTLGPDWDQDALRW